MANLIVTTSWDDGHKCDMRVANLLDKYGLKGTFYIPRYFYLSDGLSSEQMRGLDRRFEVGSHTVHHVNLPEQPSMAVSDEVMLSKTYLEDIVGRKVRMFSYPNGKYNALVKQTVRACGYIGARTAHFGSLAWPKDKYEWGITMQLSNRVPREALMLTMQYELSAKALVDWETRAMEMFNRALRYGGIFHLFGHSPKIQDNHEWGKLRRVLKYISGEDFVAKTNGEILTEMNHDNL